MGAGTFSFDKAGTNTQTFTTTTIGGGAFIKNTVATDTLDLGALSLGTRATVAFTTTGAIKNSTYTNSNLVNGILPAWITANGGADWAVADANGNITAYTGYTSITNAQAPVSTQNRQANNGASAVNASGTINSLSVQQDFTVNTGVALTIGSGGLILGGTERWLKAGSTTTSTIQSGLAIGELYVHANTRAIATVSRSNQSSWTGQSPPP